MSGASATHEKELLQDARKAQQFAHVPYTGRGVGAAVRASNGEIYKGCTVEIASFVGSICAEQAAFGAALASGALPKELAEIAIVPASYPCGVCRQMMLEANPGMILVIEQEGKPVRLGLAALLPHSFDGEAIG